MSDVADETVNRKGTQTSEFWVLAVLSTILVLGAPLVGYQLDDDNIKILLGMYTGYGALRGGHKITSIVKGAKNA